MKIVIAGAGEVGFHIAKLLANESQDIIVVDIDRKRLSRIDNALDVMVRRGDVSSFRMLESLKIEDVDIFIAVTDMQNTNLVSALLANKLGAKKTIARVTNPEFLKRENTLAINRMGIDMLISPEQLVAKEIFNLVEESIFSEMHSFEGGALNMFGVILDENAPICNRSVDEVSLQYESNNNFVPIFIIRTQEKGYETIIPRGETIYKDEDHVYFISLKKGKKGLYEILGKKKQNLSDVIILGGGRIGTKTAALLHANKHRVKIIERNKEKAEDLVNNYLDNDIMVICGDGRDADFLEEEGILDTDAFVAVTGRSETNIMACLLAKSKGVKKTIALVENTDYIHLSQEIGIDAFINKKLMAANAIFKHIRRGKVLDVTNLYDLQAEVLEYKVDQDSKIAHQKIADLKFPKEAILGGVIRKEKGFIPAKDFEILPNDRVVVFSEPKTISEVEKFFLV